MHAGALEQELRFRLSELCSTGFASSMSADSGSLAWQVVFVERGGERSDFLFPMHAGGTSRYRSAEVTFRRMPRKFVHGYDGP